MLKRLPTVLLAAAVLTATLSAQSANAATKWSDINDTGLAWVYGTTVHGFSCWNSGGSRPTLQMKVGGRWLTKAKAISLSKSSGLCKSPGYRWAAKYTFTLDELGAPSATSGVYKLQLREIIPGSGSRKTTYTQPWVKEVFESEDAQIAAYLDALNEVASGGTSGTATAPASGWSGCFFAGKPMYGTVKVVDYGYADFTVKVVSYGADLKVKQTTTPWSCGEWKIVKSGYADFTVKLVDFGYSDFTIKWVDYAPGRF